jgi:hypothetical protein
MAETDLTRLRAIAAARQAQLRLSLSLAGSGGVTSADPEVLRNTGAWADPSEQPMAESSIAAQIEQQQQNAPRADGFEQSAGNLGSRFARGAVGSVAALPEIAAIAGAALQQNRKDALDEHGQVLAQEAEDLLALIEDTDPSDPRQEGWQRALQGNLEDLGWMDRQQTAEGETRLPQERAGMGLGADIREAGEDTFGKPDPRDDTFLGDVAEGLGTTVGIAAGTLVGGPAAGAVQGSAMAASDAYKEALAMGADEETARQAAIWNSLIGATEVLPVMRAFDRLPASLRGEIGNRFLKTLTSIAKESGEEAAQEYAQTVMGNVVAQNLYDPERGWNKDAGYSALVGAVAGGTFAGAVEVGGQIMEGRGDQPEQPGAPTPPRPTENSPFVQWTPRGLDPDELTGLPGSNLTPEQIATLQQSPIRPEAGEGRYLMPTELQAAATGVSRAEDGRPLSAAEVAGAQVNMRPGTATEPRRMTPLDTAAASRLLTQEDLASTLPSRRIAEGKARIEELAPMGGNDAAFGLDADGDGATDTLDPEALFPAPGQTDPLALTPDMRVDPATSTPEARPTFQDGSPARGQDDGDVLVEMDDATGEPIPTGRRFRYNQTTDTLDLLTEQDDGPSQTATSDGGAGVLQPGRDQPAARNESGDRAGSDPASRPRSGLQLREEGVQAGTEAAAAVPAGILPSEPARDLSARDRLMGRVGRALAERGNQPETLPNGATVGRDEAGKFTPPPEPKAQAQATQGRGVTARTPELQAAAAKVAAGEMTQAEYQEVVNQSKPVRPYESVPEPEPEARIRSALKESQQAQVGVPDTLEDGAKVGLRLDIPAYANHDTWVVSVHEQQPGFSAGPVIGYSPTARARNVTFGMPEKAALSIAQGSPKGTIATMKGDWVKSDHVKNKADADAALKDPSWRQVGMDPERHSYFYDRETQQPITAADEVIQVGPLVLAKNPTYADAANYKFQARGTQNTETSSAPLTDAAVSAPSNAPAATAPTAESQMTEAVKALTEVARMMQQGMARASAPGSAPKAQAQAADPNYDGTEESVRSPEQITMPALDGLPEAEALAEIHRMTEANAILVQALMAKIDAKFGTKSGDNRKEDEKIVSKSTRPSILAKKPWFTMAHIRDSYRFKTVIPTIADVPGIFQMLLDSGISLVKIDTAKLFNPGEWGWRIIAFDLRMPNGQLVEWYLPIEELEAQKKSEGHHIFEKWRNLTVDELVEQQDEYDADVRRSYEGYQSAFRSALSRMGLSEPEAKALWTKSENSMREAARNSLSSSASGIDRVSQRSDQTPSERVALPSSTNSQTLSNPPSSTSAKSLVDTSSTPSGSNMGTAAGARNAQAPTGGRVEDVAGYDNAHQIAHTRPWPTIRDLKMELQGQVRDAAEAVGHDLQGRDFLTRMALADGMLALEQNSNAVGWYDVKTRQALAVIALVHPEVATDPNKRLAFVWALAVTSNGNKVDKNFELADKAYRGYKATGRMPTNIGIGQAGKPINDALQAFNALRDQRGLDWMREFMLTEATAGEISRMSGMKVGGEYAETVVRGAAILGPKIGNGFFSNLYGKFDALTMDRWLIRTWGRWTGTLVMPEEANAEKQRERVKRAMSAVDVQEQIDALMSVTREKKERKTGRITHVVPEPGDWAKRDRLIEALRAYDGTDAGAEALGFTMADSSEDARLRPSMDGELRKAANMFAKYGDGQKEQPASPGERNFIRDVFGRALEQIKKDPRWADLTMADLQAALWYGEKRLYETATAKTDGKPVTGYEDDEAPDYANAAVQVARKAGVPEDRIQAALEQEANRGGTRVGAGSNGPANAGRGTREGDQASGDTQGSGGVAGPRLQAGALQRVPSSGVQADLIPGRLSYELDDNVLMRAEALQQAFHQEAQKLGLQGVTVGVASRLFSDGNQVNAAYFNTAIVVALEGDSDKMTSFHHEALHFLRDEAVWGNPTGLFKAPEWRTLAAAANADPEVVSYVDDHYDSEPSVMEEERVARLYELWLAGDRSPKGFVRDGLQKIKNFLTALRNALNGQGFQTADDVFRRVNSGVVGRRGANNDQETGAGTDGGAEGVRGEGEGQGSAAAAGTGSPEGSSAAAQAQRNAGLGSSDEPVTAGDLEGLTTPETLRDFLKRPGWAILTATAPREGAFYENNPENVARADARDNANLRADLSRGGHSFVEAEGVYKGESDGISLLVVIPEGEALKLGRRYNQESILTRDGLVYSLRPLPPNPSTGEVMVGDEALAEDFHTLLPGGMAFSMGLDFSTGPGVPVLPAGTAERADRPQLPVRPDGMVELYHWSDKNLTTVDPEKAGSGPLQGAERKRGSKTSFWGINPRENATDPGTGYVKEGGLGSNRHVALVPADRLYPFFEDPDSLRTEGMTDGAYEAAIKEAGYMGTYVTDDGNVRKPKAPLGNVATLFEAVPVKPAPTPEPKFRRLGAGPLIGPGVHPLSMPNPTVYAALHQAQKGFWHRLKSAAPDAWDTVRRKVQDKMLPLLRAQQSVETMIGSKLPDDFNAYQREELFSSRAGDKLDRLDREVVEPIIGLIKGADGLTPDMVGKWLRARHAPERNRRIAQVNPKMPDGGAGITTADAQAYMASLSRYAPVLNQIAAKLDKLRNDMIDFRVDMGLITPDHGKTLKAMFKNYVPLQGFADAGGEPELDTNGIGSRYNIKGKEIEAAMGRSSEAFNPLIAMIVQSQETIIRGEKNRVGQAVLSLAETYPSPNLWEVKKATTVRYVSKSTGLVTTRTQSPINPFQNPNELAVKRGGEEYRITLHDPRLVAALGNVGSDRLHPIIAILGSFTRMLSMMNTTLDPEFLIRNATRDFTAAQLNLRGSNDVRGRRIAAATRKNVFRAFLGARGGLVGKDATVWQKHYQEYAKAGGKISFWTLDNPEAGLEDFNRRLRLARGNIASRFLKVSTSPRALLSSRDNAVLNWIERQNLALDNATRLAAFVAARQEGMTTDQAASLAKNLTVNFNRRGEWGSWMNALFMFANASVQGLHTFIKFFTSKKGLMLSAALVGAGFAMDMVNASLSDEDDDGTLFYDKIPDYKNATNLTVMLGAGSDDAATIWMPYVYGLFPYMGQQLSKAVRGVKDPDEALVDVALAALSQVAPIQGGDLVSTVLPTALDPAYEIAQNRDWMDRPIMPEDAFGTDYSPDAYRYFPGVTMFSREIAQGLNDMTGGDVATSGVIDVSPENLDHLKDFVLGGFGRFADRGQDLVAKMLSGEAVEQRDIPFARSLYHKVEDYIDRERYYEFRDLVQGAAQQVETYRANDMPIPDETRSLAGLETQLKAIEKGLKELRSMRDQVDASDMGVGERASRRATIQSQETDLFLRFNGMVQDRIGVQAE